MGRFRPVFLCATRAMSGPVCVRSICSLVLLATMLVIVSERGEVTTGVDHATEMRAYRCRMSVPSAWLLIWE